MSDLNMNIQDPTGTPDDVNGIGGFTDENGISSPGSMVPDQPVGQGGLLLPDSFIRGIIAAPFNVAHAVWKDACPPLSDTELNSGILPIQSWIQEGTAGMAIEKPGQIMAIMWLGTMIVPRALSVLSSREQPKKKKTSNSTRQEETVEQDEEVLSIGNGYYVEPELR